MADVKRVTPKTNIPGVVAQLSYMARLQIIPSGRGGCLRLILRLAVTFAVIAAIVLYMVKMPGKSYSGALAPLTKGEIDLSSRLHHHVSMLAGTIGERNQWHFGKIEAAAAYIENELRASGYDVSWQEYTAKGKSYKNIEAQREGTSGAEEIVIVGAHYDSVSGTPGANDNASGVGAALEIARIFSREAPERTVRFVFFANEEPPFFQTPLMGSRVYAARCKQRGENITAMLSLETIGYYSDEPGSQRYPFPFNLMYPDTGNFIGFAGNLSSRALVHKVVGSFRTHTAFPSEGVAAPAWIPGIGWSDQWSFWEEGYPGVMVTDTALFRYRYYHEADDTPDKIDYEKTARVVMGISRVVEDLSKISP